MSRAFFREPRNIVLLFAGTALVLWMVVLWPIELRLRARIKGLSPAEIVSITMQDTPKSSSVTPRSVVTLNESDCREFLRLLASAHSYSPNHPKGGWTRFVRIVTREREFYFPISATSNNGTYLSLYSRGTDGWNFGCLRNDALQTFVENLFSNRVSAVTVQNP